MDFGNDIMMFAQGLDWYAWVILPIIIFCARICDVTLGTIRIIMVSRGKRRIAPLLGFFEVLIWIVVIGQLVQHLQSWVSYVAYAAGFASGNFIGMYIEDRLALGMVIIRVILQQGGEDMIARLHDAGYGVTCFDGRGANGPVKMIFTVIRRQDLPVVNKLIHQAAPKAFISVEDVRSAEEGVFPSRPRPLEDLLTRRKMK